MLLFTHDTDLIPKFQVLIPKTATCTLCTRPHTAQTNSGLLVQRRDNSSSSRHSLSYNYTRIKIHHTWESTSWGHQGREKRENLLPNRFAIAYAIAARFNKNSFLRLIWLLTKKNRGVPIKARWHPPKFRPRETPVSRASKTSFKLATKMAILVLKMVT